MFRLILSLQLVFLITITSAQSVYRQADDPKNISELRNKDITWLKPNSFLKAELFNRVELAVDLPQEIEKRINYFLETDDSTKGINPFLEWQLDVTAAFFHYESQTKKVVDAFYYNNYSRDTSHSDFRNWKWNREETPNFMRVRFAPPETGEWGCAVTIKTKDTLISFIPFNFSVESSDNKGFIEVGLSKRFFTLGDETYFPSGQNLVSPRCEFCFVNTAKVLPSEKNGPAAQSLESWMLRPTVVKGFLMFQDHMKNLAASGGNYFRELLMPQNQDIEWAKLGNYYDRMNCAWELDEQFFLAEQLDLKMQLNLQIQFALEADRNRIFWNWSADPNDKRHKTAENPCSNPYNRQISTTKNGDPNTFFSDETAKKFFKQKLRYIHSRWGYSTSLAIYGMASEIQTPCTDPSVCVSWSEEMGNYLKNELKIDQLLTPSFLGIFHDSENYENKIIALKDYDMSAYNWYSASPSKHQSTGRIIRDFNTGFQKPFFYGEIGNANLYNCDTARIEWIRDSWMSAFSGNAGVGMNWDEPFDDELRIHLGNINQFMKGINFDGNGDPWESNRVISDNRKAETIFLLSPDKKAAVGVISNRYYNWYETADTLSKPICSNRIPTDPGFNPTRTVDKKGVWEKTYNENPKSYIDRVSKNSQMNEAVVYYPFESFDHLKSENYRLRIYGLTRGKYTVDFYNALTLEYLGSETNWGPNVRLEYPEMNESTGMIAFKIYRSDTFPQE